MQPIKSIDASVGNSPAFKEAVVRFSERFPSRGDVLAWSDQHTVEHSFQGRTFHYIRHIPREYSGTTLVFGGEYANGNKQVTNIARATIMADAIDPQASIIFLPGTNLERKAFDFTKEEMGQLSDGVYTPIVDRYRSLLSHDEVSSNLVLFGPSQGAFTLGNYAAHPDTPATALTLLEAPNTLDRSAASLAKEYLSSGSMLQENLKESFSAIDGTSAYADIMKGISTASLIRYGLGALRPENLAVMNAMRRSSLEQSVELALEKGGSVVQAWGTGAAVSGDEANASIAVRFASAPRYESLRITGGLSDHSVTNQIGLCALLMERSRQLLAAPQMTEIT